MLKKLQKHLQEDRNIFLLILLGSFVWSLTMIKSGLNYSFGIGFWGPNGHDGVWHLSLAQELAKPSLNLPIWSGGSITNYHIGFDLLLAAIHRLTFIPLSILYFQIFPVLISLSIGFLTYIFFKRLKFDKKTIFWILFFIYFAGNIGWLVNYLRFSSLGGGSMFWAQPNMLTLINPPYALSIVFILLGLLLVQSKKYTFAAIIFGLLIQVKAYAAVVILPSMLIAGIYEYRLNKKIQLIKLSIFSGIISALIFLPFNLSSTSLFVWKPFWFLETMMQFPDRVGWARFGEAMINYKLAGNYIKLVPAYIVAFAIFWYGNLGTRFIAEMYVLRFRKNKAVWYEVLFLSAILIGLFIPMLFVQRGTAWNTIQFFYYSLFFASILSGIVFSGIIRSTKSKLYKKVLILGILFFTLPTTYDTLKHYLPMTPPAMISNKEIEALEFLANLDDGIVLIPSFDRDLGAYKPAPRPLYYYESTSYVSAYTGKQVFMEDEVNLDITGFNWQQRKLEIDSFFEKPDRKFLDENNIKYIYIPNAYGYKLDYEKSFQNEEITIYKVK